MSYFTHLMRTLAGLLFRRPILGTCVIPLLADGRVVLILRRDNRQWALPGGLVDWGEDVLSAADRELWEEAGMRVAQVNRLVGVYSRRDRDPRFHSVCVAVAVTAEGQPHAADPREVLDVQAFAPEAIPWDNLSHDHSEHLRDFFSGKTVLA